MSTTMTSARLPASIAPIVAPMPERAPRRRASPCRAPSGACSAARVVAASASAGTPPDRIASNMSRSLLLAAPSVPRPTLTPGLEVVDDRRGAARQLHVALGVVRDGDAAPPSAPRCRRARPTRRARRASAAPRSRALSQVLRRRRLCRVSAASTSARVSARWISSGTSCLSASARQRLERLRIERVERVRRHRRRDQVVSFNCVMNASVRARPSSGVFASATGNSITVWPRTPRRPASLAAAATSSSK